MHKKKTSSKALPVHHMRKFLPILSTARDSAACPGANIIRVDLAGFYPDMKLALRRRCWVLILPFNSYKRNVLRQKIPNAD